MGKRKVQMFTLAGDPCPDPVEIKNINLKRMPLVGCRYILDANKSFHFQTFIQCCTLIAYVVVISDFVWAMTVGDSEKENHTLVPFVSGSLSNFLFCYDFIFLIYLFIDIKLKHAENKLYNIFAALTGASLVPFELFYWTVSWNNTPLYYTLRLRYLLRLGQFILHFVNVFSESTTSSASIFVSLFKFCVMGLTICHTVSVLTLYLHCQNAKTQIHNCSSLNASDFILSFAVHTGLMTHAHWIQVLYQNHLILAIYQYFIYLFIFHMACKIICILIANNCLRYEFAIQSSMVLKAVSNIKKHKSSWCVRDYMHEKFVRRHLNFLWGHWEKVYPEIMQQDFARSKMPSIMTAEISLDVSWNMFKHSVLFRNESVHFLRYISTLTKCVVLTQGQPIIKVGDPNNFMLYIISGTVDIMSEHNLESPVLSVTSGTVLGEMTLFLTKYPQTNVVCRDLCECIILSRTKFLDCKKKYPDIYDKLRKAAFSRVEMARKYYEINDEYFKHDYTNMEKRRASLRYIKKVIREHTKGHDPYLAIAHMLSERRIAETVETENIVYCPHYLPMYSITNTDQTNANNHFLQTGWSFKIHPDSPLLKFYKVILYALITLHTLAGPVWYADEDVSSAGFFSIYTYAVSALWIFDFLMYGFVGCKDQGRIYVDYEHLFDQVTSNWKFWVDFVAMVPFEVIYWAIEGPFLNRHYRYFQMNRFLKAYKLMDFIDSVQFSTTKHMVIMTAVKILMTYYCLLTMGHYVFTNFGYYDLVRDRWRGDGVVWKFFLVSMFYQSQVPFIVDFAKGTNMLGLIVLQIFIIIWMVYYKTQMCVSFSLHLSPYIEYENVVDDTKRTFILNKFDPIIKRKINKYLSLHYQHDRGLEFLKIKRMKQLLGNTLYKTHQIMSFEDLLMGEALFRNLPYEIVRDLASPAALMLIPKGEILVSAGALPKEMYFLVEGTCAYVTDEDRHHKVIKRLDKGSSVLVLEVLSRVKVVHNVMTLTDCKVLNVSFQHFEHKLIGYPKHYKMMAEVLKETVNRDRLFLMQTKEISYEEEMMNVENNSFQKFKKGEKSYLHGFGKKQVMRFLFLRTTINPRGRFWVYWEIFQFCCCYFSAYLSTIPLLTAKTSESPMFWLLRLFDVVALVDMYLRQHVFYYNRDNIEISHPLKTATHYWTSSFVIDLIGSFPFELVLRKQDSAFALIMYRINRVLKLYRAIGLRLYLIECYLGEKQFLDICFYILTAVLALGFAPYTLMLDCVIYEEVDEIECKGMPRQNFHYLHLTMVHTSIKYFFNFGVFSKLELQKITWDIWLLNHTGFIASMLIISRIMAMGLSRNSFLTTFQLKMHSLVTFMAMRKIDKRLKSEIIKHYEYLWLLREGKTLKETFNCFSLACYEEVMYSQLKSTLQQSVVFKPFPKVVMKDFLSSEDLKREMILIKGVIIRVNDIQNKIYILSKGTVEAVGPDLTMLERLDVGSVFGCLDDVPYHRSTLTYVAMTHCELLSIPSYQFYNSIRKYPNLYKHFNSLVKTSNIDFIATRGLTDLRRAQKYASIYNPKAEQQQKKKKKINLFSRVIHFLFGIRRPHPVVTCLMSLMPILNFTIECYQKIVMSFHWSTVALCYTCDALFMLQIYLRMRESYEDDYGLWVMQRKLILKRYVKSPSGLIFHIICIFPFEIVSFFLTGSENFFVCWSYLRLNRILQIIIVVKFLTVLTNRLKVNVFVVRMCRILVCVYFLQHICMVMLGNYKGQKDDSMSTNINWYLKYFSLTTYLYTSGIMYIYLYNINFNYITYILNTIMILVTHMFVTYVMADFLASYQVCNYGKYIEETFLTRLRADMHRKHICLPLRKRLIKYFQQTTFGYKSTQFPEFIADAPYYLREGVLNSMFGFLLRHHPIFKECHVDLIRQVSANFETRYFYAEDFITFIGDIDDCMYFIYSGEVNCLSADTLQFEKVAKTYKAGDSFGFTQLFYENTGHKYTYKVAHDCLLLTLHKNKVLHLFNFFPASKYIIYNYQSYMSKKQDRK